MDKEVCGYSPHIKLKIDRVSSIQSRDWGASEVNWNFTLKLYHKRSLNFEKSDNRVPHRRGYNVIHSNTQ